jgi:hypothetical protein
VNVLTHVDGLVCKVPPTIALRIPVPNCAVFGCVHGTFTLDLEALPMRNLRSLAVSFAAVAMLVGCGSSEDPGVPGAPTPTPTPSPSPSPTPTPSPSPSPSPSPTNTTSIDALYLSTFALTALSSDAIPTVAKPTVKATSLATPSYIDPVYGTRIYKATDPSDFPGATAVRHDYSRRQAWNADNTRYLAQASSGYWLLYDANAFTRLTRKGTNGALANMAGDAEPIWHPTDPKKLWHTGQNGSLIWYEKDVETDTETVMANFSGRLPWPGATSVWTKAEGTSSANGCRFAFIATNYDDKAHTNTIYGLFTYDRCTDTILGTLNASVFGSAFPDHISMSPSGSYAVPSWAFNKPLGTRAYKVDFSSSIQLHTMSEHSDLAIGPNGEDYYVVTDYDNNYIRAVDMATGSSIDLMPMYPRTGSGYAAHISGKAYGRPGWVAISIYSDSAAYGATSPDPVLQPMYRKIMLVELKADGRQLNVAHTRVAANYGGYWGEPQVTISKDGSRLMFASNFNDSGEPSSYMIALPSWVYR